MPASASPISFTWRTTGSTTGSNATLVRSFETVSIRSRTVASWPGTSKDV